MHTNRERIIEVTTRIAWYADHRDWQHLPDLFADTVVLDYTSLAGGEPVTVAPVEIARSWEAALGGLDATQHLVSNHLVTVADDELQAEATAQFVATHVFANPHGDPIWTLGGKYHWTLRQESGAWRVASMRMTATWASGNQQIMSLAAAKASDSSR